MASQEQGDFGLRKCRERYRGILLEDLNDQTQTHLTSSRGIAILEDAISLVARNSYDYFRESSILSARLCINIKDSEREKIRLASVVVLYEWLSWRGWDYTECIGYMRSQKVFISDGH